MFCKLDKFLLLFALAFSFQTKAADPVAVGVDAENPPFMYSAAGKPAGLYPAIIAAAFQTMGQPVQISAKPWKRCTSDTDEGIAGTGGIYKNEARLKKYDFSDPIFVERMAVYFNQKNPVKFATVADLLGKKVGVIRGWSYGDDFDNAVKAGKITTDEVKGDEQNFQKLAAGRVDAVLAIDEAGTANLKTGQYAGIEKSGKYLFENPTFLAFNKSRNQTEVLTRFNKAVTEMKTTGALDKIASAELSK